MYFVFQWLIVCFKNSSNLTVHDGICEKGTGPAVITTYCRYVARGDEKMSIMAMSIVYMYVNLFNNRVANTNFIGKAEPLMVLNYHEDRRTT